jgi:hypothetical protein
MACLGTDDGHLAAAIGFGVARRQASGLLDDAGRDLRLPFPTDNHVGTRNVTGVQPQVARPCLAYELVILRGVAPDENDVAIHLELPRR